MDPLVEVFTAHDAPLLALPFFGGGDPGPITATMAHVPELLEPIMGFLGPILSPSAVDWRTKEIVIVRTSALLSCRYCIDSHTTVALDAGLTNDEVHSLRGETSIESGFTDPRDLALLAWIDAVAGGRGGVSDQTSAATREAFTQAEIVELTILIGATMLLNRYATSMRLPTSDTVSSRLITEGFSI